jgi:Zn-dependent protease with chaperone function
LITLLILAQFVVVQGSIGLWLERQADAFAAATVGAEPLARALKKLAELNTVKGRTGGSGTCCTSTPG